MMYTLLGFVGAVLTWLERRYYHTRTYILYCIGMQAWRYQTLSQLPSSWQYAMMRTFHKFSFIDEFKHKTRAEAEKMNFRENGYDYPAAGRKHTALVYYCIYPFAIRAWRHKRLRELPESYPWAIARWLEWPEFVADYWHSTRNDAEKLNYLKFEVRCNRFMARRRPVYTPLN